MSLSRDTNLPLKMHDLADTTFHYKFHSSRLLSADAEGMSDILPSERDVISLWKRNKLSTFDGIKMESPIRHSAVLFLQVRDPYFIGMAMVKLQPHYYGNSITALAVRAKCNFLLQSNALSDQFFNNTASINLSDWSQNLPACKCLELNNNMEDKRIFFKKNNKNKWSSYVSCLKCTINTSF